MPVCIKLCRGLAQKNPNKFKEDVAETLNKFADFHKGLNQNNKAEQEYQEALKLFKELAKDNPGKFNPYVAVTLDNYADLYRQRCQGPSKSRLIRFLHGLFHRDLYQKSVSLSAEAREIAKQYPDNPKCRKILETAGQMG